RPAPTGPPRRGCPDRCPYRRRAATPPAGTPRRSPAARGPARTPAENDIEHLPRGGISATGGLPPAAATAGGTGGTGPAPPPLRSPRRPGPTPGNRESAVPPARGSMLVRSACR